MNIPAPELNLLTLDDVAGLVKVSKWSVEQWVAAQALDSFRKGQIRRVTMQALVTFVVQNTLRARKPKWLTPEIEDQFLNLLRQIVRAEIAALNEQQKAAA